MATVVLTDCKFFLGDRPCEWGGRCDGCEYYAPAGKQILVVKLAAAGDAAAPPRDHLAHLAYRMLRRQNTDGSWGRSHERMLASGLVPYLLEEFRQIHARHMAQVIENMREPNYFSEKLVDAVLCSTVPIYWGCPNLDRFVDPDGIIQAVC